MSKEEMIRRLVQHSVSTALSEPRHYWLAELFENGFSGYRRLSRSQLERELQMRGLSGAPEAPEEDAEEPEFDDDAARTLDMPLRTGSLELE